MRSRCWVAQVGRPRLSWPVIAGTKRVLGLWLLFCAGDLFELAEEVNPRPDPQRQVRAPETLDVHLSIRNPATFKIGTGVEHGHRDRSGGNSAAD